jgi:mannan polymerase II complex MNN10 subunit
MRKHGANGYPSFSTQNQGFFTRHMRRISSSLPRFNSGTGNTYAEREKFERGGYSQNPTSGGRIRSFFARIGRRLKWRILLPLIIFCTIVVYYGTRKWNHDFLLVLFGLEIG